MPSPLSLDLRLRVLAKVDAGMSRTAASKLFLVTRRTIYNWLKKRSQDGHLCPDDGYQKGHSHKIKDFLEFKKFVDLNPSRTAAEIASNWGNISKMTVWRSLKKIGYSHKKKAFNTKKEARINGKSF